jgi:hypothetical protein
VAVAGTHPRVSIPPPGDDRRAYLHALTKPQLRELAREHGIDQPIEEACWGWGAQAAGLPPDTVSVVCDQCHRATGTPLWYYDGTSVMVRCWSCALIAHLTECEVWSN